MGIARLLLSDILIERRGDETAPGVKEASNEGKSYHALYILCPTMCNFLFLAFEILFISIFITDKLWPNDKYGFQFAYAIRLNQKWMVKLVGGDWEARDSDWKPADESIWRKFVLLANLSNLEICDTLKR